MGNDNEGVSRLGIKQGTQGHAQLLQRLSDGQSEHADDLSVSTRWIVHACGGGCN